MTLRKLQQKHQGEFWSMVKTGYFARPTERGMNEKVSSVHLVCGQHPICGYKPHRTMRFQFCANFPFDEYVKCPKCKEILRDAREKANKG
jgi:hypothetical protein